MVHTNYFSFVYSLDLILVSFRRRSSARRQDLVTTEMPPADRLPTASSAPALCRSRPTTSPLNATSPTTELRSCASAGRATRGRCARPALQASTVNLRWWAISANLATARATSTSTILERAIPSRASASSAWTTRTATLAVCAPRDSSETLSRSRTVRSATVTNVAPPNARATPVSANVRPMSSARSATAAPLTITDSLPVADVDPVTALRLPKVRFDI